MTPENRPQSTSCPQKGFPEPTDRTYLTFKHRSSVRGFACAGSRGRLVDDQKDPTYLTSPFLLEASPVQGAEGAWSMTKRTPPTRHLNIFVYKRLRLCKEHPTVRPSDHTTRPPHHPTISLSNDRATIRPSARPTIELSDCAPIRPSDHPTIRTSDRLTVRPSDCPTVPPSDCPTIRPSHRPTVRPCNERERERER